MSVEDSAMEDSAAENSAVEDSAVEDSAVEDSAVNVVGAALAALASQGTVAVRANRDLVVVAGDDAAEYLQGQLSQDVVGLEVGATRWSFVLQPQGKVDAWFRVTRLAADRFVFDVETGFGSTVVDRLNRFKLRVAVDVSTFDVGVVSFRGHSASEHAAALADRLAATAVPADWSSLGGFDVLMITAEAEPIGPGVDLETATSVTWVDPAFLEWDRINRSVPAMGSELNESTIPASAAVVDVSTDFTKGCYVGQELVARVDSRGSNTPTKLVKVAADAGLAVAPGSPLIVDGGEVGQLTSTSSSGSGLVALGYLRRSVIDSAETWPIAASVVAQSGEPVSASVEVVSHRLTG